MQRVIGNGSKTLHPRTAPKTTLGISRRLVYEAAINFGVSEAPHDQDSDRVRRLSLLGIAHRSRWLCNRAAPAAVGHRHELPLSRVLDHARTG